LKQSIRTKLFIGISIFTLIIIGIVWILNTQFLGKFYLERKKDRLLDESKYINSVYTGNIYDIYLELEEIESSIGGKITIISQNGYVKYSTSPSMGMGHMMGRGNLFNVSGAINKALNGETALTVYEHPRFLSKTLALAAPLNNGDILVIETSIQIIEEGISITKDFYIYMGVISLTIGILLSYMFSRAITKPIVDLNNIAKKMAYLDFSSRYKVKSNDEIGELGKTINYLSEKLNKTITDLNKANEKLKDDIEKERKLENMRKEFVSNVSHELKTPISLIQGYAEGLKDSIANDEESREFYCDVIMDESKRMGKLVNDLLDLSQLESGHFKLKKNNFNIVELVSRVVEKYNPIFEDKNISVDIDIKESTLLVNGDKNRIEQVLINLINNGVNHVKNERIIRISALVQEEKVRIGVYNSGDYIEDDEIKRIWDRFYKIDKARRRNIGGTGLGLSIVKRILELHENQYGVINLDNGVEFWFYIDKVQ
jgi:signal transduction histidine kinase